MEDNGGSYHVFALPLRSRKVQNLRNEKMGEKTQRQRNNEMNKKKKRQTKSANLERVQNEDLLCYFLLTLSFRGLEANIPQYLSSRVFPSSVSEILPFKGCGLPKNRAAVLFIYFLPGSVRAQPVAGCYDAVWCANFIGRLSAFFSRVLSFFLRTVYVSMLACLGLPVLCRRA